jgi:ribosomal protein S18 acetylase RimI-like enzyme
MAEVSVRPAALDDAREIASVHRLSRADYYGVPSDPDDDREAMWAQFLAQPERVTFVAEASGAIVGFMSAQRVTSRAAELKMTAIYVHPSRYGSGIGSRLHDLFDGERASEEPGVLEVWAGNVRAIDFYRRRGWIPTSGARPGPQDIDFVTYRLPARAQGD